MRSRGEDAQSLHLMQTVTVWDSEHIFSAHLGERGEQRVMGQIGVGGVNKTDSSGNLRRKEKGGKSKRSEALCFWNAKEGGGMDAVLRPDRDITGAKED